MLKPAKMLGVFSPIRICHAGAHLLQAYISYRRVQLVGVRVLMFGRHTTVLGGMRWLCYGAPEWFPFQSRMPNARWSTCDCGVENPQSHFIT